MAEFDRSIAQPRAATAEVDVGLRSYMLRVYNYMASGLGITGLAAIATYMAAVQTTDAGRALTPLGQLLFASNFAWVVIFAPLALVFFLSFRVHKMSVGAAQLTFWVYAALVGVSFASLGLIYAHESIARVFFITAASFGALSMWGYTTRRDLTGMGSFLFMGLVGAHHRVHRQHLPGVFGHAVRDLRGRRAGVCRAHRLRHPEDQGDVSWYPIRAKWPGARRSWARSASTSTSSTCSSCCCGCSAIASSSGRFPTRPRAATPGAFLLASSRWKRAAVAGRERAGPAPDHGRA